MVTIAVTMTSKGVSWIGVNGFDKICEIWTATFS